MKTKILFISFISCLVLQAKAQTYTNTIVNDNSSWSVLYRNSADGSYMCTDYYYFDGDTIAEGKVYKKLFLCKDKEHTEYLLYGFVREENQKTYFVKNILFTPTNFSLENVLYDFTLKQDTIFERTTQYADYYGNIYRDTVNFYVQSCDSILIGEKLKKRLMLAGCYVTSSDTTIFNVIDTIIESIGSLYGLLYPACYYCVGGISELLCYYEDNELIYKNPKRSECYYDRLSNSVQEIANTGYTVFPNPVDDVFNISYLNIAISRIEIFDNLGRKVYNQTYKDAIDISSFSKGVYFLKVYDANEQVSVFKIIKK